MKPFVAENSIVRAIWGKSDTILFIFAGAAAEFALNKAVDWLYFTGKLPADPIGRLFSTVAYARKIVFANEEAANAAIDQITSIHKHVEDARGHQIPDWAYRDVLYMLIYYSIAAYELLERKLTNTQLEEVFQVFYRVGSRMGLKELPHNYNDWLTSRKAHLQSDLAKSSYTVDLFKQYRKRLGRIRYRLLLGVQKLVVPPNVIDLMQWRRFSIVDFLLPLYKFLRILRMSETAKKLLLPVQYISEVKELDIITNR